MTLNVGPAEEVTPLMRQYRELKAQAGDALLFFRMGDFYELFGDDAVVAARLLEITLTSRDKGKANPMPMAGVPHHSAQSYIQRLLKAGKKVAICEQFEDPNAAPAKGGKSIVRRELVRTFTPAVQFDAETSDSSYLATAIADENRWVLACLDASTGEARVSDPMSEDTLAVECSGLPIRHFIRLGHHLPESAKASLVSAGALVEDLPTNYLSLDQAVEALKRHYGIESLSTFLGTNAAIQALGVLVTYAVRTQQQERLAHLRLPSPLHRPKTLALGPRTPQHLDLVPSQEGAPSLYQLINRTRSALGARQLKRWILEPLKDPTEIRTRQDAVRELSQSEATCSKLSDALAELYDLERISGRVNARLANPRDTLALGRSLAILPQMGEALSRSQAPLLQGMAGALRNLGEELSPLSDRILKTQREDAPLVSRDGGIFNRGTTPELDHLLSLTEDGQRWLVELEAREREQTGISSLKVRYNRVFGYYIEVTQAHLKNVPAHYQRKQTTVGAERFFTEELKKFEDEIVTASARQKSLEQELFEELVRSVQSQTATIMEAAVVLGELDALISLARLAQEPGWCFPQIDDSLDLEIRAGRHPLVDVATRGSFVPNDLSLSPESRNALLITGPNMGGKSTVMRQVALIIILGQAGAPVPATEARWGSISSLHTRIGAHDAIARGQSTFMVEMSELAHILHHADERSLIVLDEIGRGTSTYDGISVAWSTLEWICRQIGARTLFATHYHELTRLAGTALPLLANAHMAVESGGFQGQLRFLYQLKEGPANESFGVHVARIAGLPAPVVERAWQVLEELEKSGAHSGSQTSSSEGHLTLFNLDPPARGKKPRIEVRLEPHPVVEELKTVNFNDLTPLQALNLLAKLQGDARTTQVSCQR